MDARRFAPRALIVALICCLPGMNVFGATARSTNFIVTAPDAAAAEQIAKMAEKCREELAIAWLGKTLPNWYRPCPITAKIGQIGAGGATTFTFDRGEVGGWKMEVQGTLERILDSVIPHEVNHTIFACHFRRPLPRWADEGAATLVEHVSERKRQETTLNSVIRTQRFIPLGELLSMAEYPKGQQVYTMYAEGYSLADFLVRGTGDEGRTKFLNLIRDAEKGGWDRAFQKHYGFQTLGELEANWKGWVLAGSPDSHKNRGEMIASISVQQARETSSAAVDSTALKGDAIAMSKETPVAASTSRESLAALPPINRELRVAEAEARGPAAPNYASLNEPVFRGQSPNNADTGLAAANADRVIPRRDPHPDVAQSVSPRMEAIMRHMQQQRRESLVESSRSSTWLQQPQTPRLTGEEGRRIWDLHSQFPTERESGPANRIHFD